MNYTAPSNIKHKKILITAGPTHEAIDPVRFIGNHSSGKMGYALAEAYASLGAKVTLVSGPVGIESIHKGIDRVKVRSAAEMFDACKAVIDDMDLAIFAAAVADFTPVEVAGQKIKRKGEDLTVKLKPTRDIAAELGKHKRSDQFFIGFALETGNGLENAQAKLQRKNLDLIVLNSLEDKGAGFGTETNKISMIDKSGNIDKFELKLKSEVAQDIVEKSFKLMKNA